MSATNVVPTNNNPTDCSHPIRAYSELASFRYKVVNFG